MVAYTAAPGDVETGEKMERRSSGLIWKLMVSVLVLILCVGGVTLFLWLWNGQQEAMPNMGQTELQTMKETDHHFTLRQISTKSQAAIHLEGNYKDAKLLWKMDVGQAFVTGGFTLDDNKITIPRSGLYFVYSQASFRVNCIEGEGEEEDLSLRPHSHKIQRQSEQTGGSSTLMGAVRSACQRGTQETGWYNAIYLGAVFQLREGDTLWTETTKLSELETDQGTTFFGVFAL